MKKAIEKGHTRRDFIKASGTGLICLTLPNKLCAQAMAQGSATSLRQVFPLNHRWLYSDKVVPNGTSAAFDDSRFARVTIPHTNKMLPWHGFDDKEFQLVSLYRRHFKLPAELERGRRVFIDFGGVMTAATATINGRRLGEYRGGYTPFSFELTPHINWRGD